MYVRGVSHCGRMLHGVSCVFVLVCVFACMSVSLSLSVSMSLPQCLIIRMYDYTPQKMIETCTNSSLPTSTPSLSCD